MGKTNFEDEVLRSLGGLHEAVGSGFEKVHKTLAEHSARLDDVDAELGNVNGRLDVIERDLAAIKETLLENHEERIRALERQIVDRQ